MGPLGTLGPEPHGFFSHKKNVDKKKSIDFHYRNNKRIKIDDTRVLWEWEEEEEEEEWIKVVWSRSWLYRDHLPTIKT